MEKQRRCNQFLIEVYEGKLERNYSIPYVVRVIIADKIFFNKHKEYNCANMYYYPGVTSAMNKDIMERIEK